MTTGSGEEAAKPAIAVTTDPSGLKPARGSKPATQVTTGFFREKAPAKGSASASEPYREWIAREWGRGRNAMGIGQDLVDGHGFTGGYQSVKRLVRELRGAKSPEARVIIETQIGEECQVDYGTGPMVGDPETGQ